MKLISKARACCLKNIISSIINENQVAYVSNRLISEGRRLVTIMLTQHYILKEKGEPDKENQFQHISSF